MNHRQCEKCNEITKRAAGSFVGADESGNRTHGVWITCDNLDCPLNKGQREGLARGDRRVKAARAANQKIGINPQEMKKARLRMEATIPVVAKMLGVSPSKYCDYEQGREPIPAAHYTQVVGMVKNRVKTGQKGVKAGPAYHTSAE